MIAERFRWLRTKCSRLFRRGKQEAALDAEMQFHLDQLIAQYRNDGMSEREARLAAQREFGATSAYREEIRDTWRPPQLADMWRSLRFAVRSLARSPGFTLLAIITLAFGIGGNTMMYSAFTTIVQKPLPYADSAQLDRFYRATPQNPVGNFSPADFLDLQKDSRGYGEVAAYMLSDTSLSEPGQPAEMVSGIRITANFLSVLGVVPQLGRDFRPREDLPGNDRVIIISQRYWQKQFGSDPTSSAEPFVSMANLTKSWAYCLLRSTTGVTSVGSISFGRLLSTKKNPPTATARCFESSVDVPVNYPARMPTALSPISERTLPPTFLRSMPARPGAQFR